MSILGYESLPKALSKDYDTESVWMRMPENVVRVYRGLLQVNENTKQVQNNYYEGVCFALKNAARMVTMTEPGGYWGHYVCECVRACVCLRFGRRSLFLRQICGRSRFFRKNL